MSAVEAIVTVPFLLSIVVGAALITRIDFRVIYAVEAAGIAVVAALFWRWARQAGPATETETDVALELELADP